MNEETLSNIREMMNKGWALGNEQICQRIEALFERQTAPRPRRGDRKSAKFEERCQINRFWPH